MNNLVFENEVTDDLQINNLQIIQKQGGFKFGTDAVLLSDFAKGAKGARLLDLCSGSGIIPLLLSAKSNMKEICGLEIQEDMAEMAHRSVLLNGLENKIKIECGDLKNCRSIFKAHSFDAVTVNPPYMKADKHLKNADDGKTVARHEVLCTIDDVAEAAAHMLKFHGNMYMIHRPKRLIDIITAMKKVNLEPKTLRFVHPRPESEPTMVLVHGTYHGGSELKIMPPLYIEDENGKKTKELNRIYGKAE